MNINNFSQLEIEKAVKRMAVEMIKYNFMGSKIDVTSQEQGSNSDHMDFIKETNETIYGFKDINS